MVNWGAMAFPSNEESGAPVGVLDSLDETWADLRTHLSLLAKGEPLLAPALEKYRSHRSLESAMASLLAEKLSDRLMGSIVLEELLLEAFQEPDIGRALRRDLRAVVARDPAAGGPAVPFLFFKGFQGLQTYRAAHFYWSQGRDLLARHLQSRVSEVFGMDIHPASRIGEGILIDHGTSVVIGETAVVGDDVSMLHEVTLGGTGKDTGDRHPKIGNGVLLGAGTKVLGNVRIGDGSKVGAGSVVLAEVPEHTTVVGVPARRVSRTTGIDPALLMDQLIDEGF